MKKRVLSLLMLSASLLLAGGTTETTTVNATAEQTCSVSNSPSLALSYTGLSDSTGNFNVDIVCNSGLAWTTTVDGGSNASGEIRRASDGTNFLSYRLYQDAGMTQELAVTSGNTVTGTGSDATQTYKCVCKSCYGG